MGQESSQKFVGRNNPPRVQIEYDVETRGALEKKQLPFVMGVFANLSGDPSPDSVPVEERKAHLVCAEDLDNVMAKIKPRLAFMVPELLGGESNQLRVELSFNSMDDFKPAAIANQVPVLKKLLQARTLLSELRGFSDGRPRAEAALAKALRAHRLNHNPDLKAALQGDHDGN